MDDDRLASELQRRASGASPRPDWAQRDLLPAVWREIDARPVQVRASRWSPLAGLATVVVAVVVLAVAIPRLAPGPFSTAQRTPRDIACALTDGLSFPVAVDDVTGLVESCEVTGPSGAGIGSAPAYVVALGDARTLEFGWIGAACSIGATVAFRSEGDGYALEPVETPSRDLCYGGIVLYAIHIQFSDRVDPIKIAAYGRGYVERPELKPSPTVVPLPTPGDVASTMACSGASSGATVSMVDHTGDVLGCASELGSETPTQDISVSNPYGNAQQLIVTMRVSSCDVRPLSLAFWAPPVGASPFEAFRPNHVLQIDRSTTTTVCVDALTDTSSETLTLTLNTAVDASNVNAFVTTGPIASSSVETHGHGFALSLSASHDTYVAESPIDVSATTQYVGPDAITVSTYGVVFGFEQLDGTLEMYPASGLMCGSLRTLEPGDQDGWAYNKSGSWDNGDPNAEFYRQYIADPLLRLPAGEYRVFAYLSFMNEHCPGESVSVTSSIVIHVR
jgi:hypothetical protein